MGSSEGRLIITGSCEETKNTLAAYALAGGSGVDAVDYGFEDGVVGTLPLDLQPVGASPHEGDVTAVELLHQGGRDYAITTSAAGALTLFALERDAGNRLSFAPVSGDWSGWRGLHEAGTSATLAMDGLNGQVATAGEDARVNVLRLADEPPAWKGGEPGAPGYSAVTFLSPSLLLTCGSSPAAQLRLWDTRRAGSLPALLLKDATPGVAAVSAAAHPLRPMLVATGNSEGAVSFWDLRSPARMLNSVAEHAGPVWSLDFHPSEPQYLFTGGEDGQVLMWDFNAGRTLEPVSYEPSEVVGGAESLAVYPLWAHDLGVNAVRVHPADDLLMSVSDNGSLLLHDQLPINAVRG